MKITHYSYMHANINVKVPNTSVCLYLIGILCRSQDYFTYTTTDRIMVEGNLVVLKGMYVMDWFDL